MTSRNRLIVGVAVAVVLAGVIGGVIWARRARPEASVTAAAAANPDPAGAPASGPAGPTPVPAVPSTPGSTAPTTPGPTPAADPRSSGTAADGGSCVLDLTWPAAAPGWIEPLDPAFTCAEMVAQWRRNEQWPGERGGTIALVDFGDGWYCTGVHWDPTLPPSNVVGSCDLGGRRFNVYQGPPGVGTSGPAAPAGPGGTDASTVAPAGAADLLITPSGNIRCARSDGRFACTIQEYDFDLGDERCPAARGPIVRLDATGPSQASSCRGDVFDGLTWPDPTPYGTTVTLGDVRCDVESTGVTCTNTEGHGFTLARAGLQPF
ncbi:hypothetical protein [Nakamurella sp.]|uniref:hypothetical protein n=1 Tax=Nakamurella sp. TaxID=1869182 RepID=UPI003B3BC800